MEDTKNQTMREVINLENVKLLSQRIKSSYSDFDEIGFNNEIKSKLQFLSLMDRILLVQNALEEFLPKDFEKAVEILLKSQLNELNNDRSDDYKSDFISVPLSGFVAKNGCTEKYFDLSMRAQYEMTKRFSCEWSIHDFIEKFEDRSFKYLLKWAKDENCHVRRLCSEGIRPKLPWSRPFRKFQKDPKRLFSILDLLYTDNNRYVIRSVCNCLNDISKTHPSLVVNALKGWEEKGGQEKKEFEWMKKHGLRTLIKQGNLEALEYLGFQNNVNVVSYVNIKNNIIKLNESLEFELKIETLEKSTLLVDYIIYFLKANGKLSPKVFKLKVLTLGKGEKVVINKNHPFKKMTTRKLYPGIHKLAVQINGKTFETKEFEFKN